MSHIQLSEANWRNHPSFRAVCNAFLKCQSEAEIADLLRDIATLSELEALSERLEVAKQLAQGKTYREAAAITGASTTTVTRVAQFLKHGEGGYRKYLARSEASNDQNSGPTRHSPSKSALQGYLKRAR